MKRNLDIVTLLEIRKSSKSRDA